MSASFDDCLVHVLTAETGYPQPVVGPLVRARDGAYYDAGQRLLVPPRGTPRHLPARPDGMAFDDDPDDTGGRTCMGVTQRVYDGYRQRVGRLRQDVWLISDDEVRDIYRQQYWQPMRVADLPGGLALTVFDMGVNAGTQTAVKLLQDVVGTTRDGHLGEATLDAGRAWDKAMLIKAYGERRRQYYRGCKTFWKHGGGWLRRVDVTEGVALGAVNPTEPPSKAPPAPPSKQAPADASGGVAVTTGVTGSATVATETAKAIGRAGKDPSWHDMLMAVAQSPVFWTGVIAVVAGVVLWINRRRMEQWK